MQINATIRLLFNGKSCTNSPTHSNTLLIGGDEGTNELHECVALFLLHLAAPEIFDHLVSEFLGKHVALVAISAVIVGLSDLLTHRALDGFQLLLVIWAGTLNSVAAHALVLLSVDLLSLQNCRLSADVQLALAFRAHASLPHRAEVVLSRRLDAVGVRAVGSHEGVRLVGMIHHLVLVAKLAKIVVCLPHVGADYGAGLDVFLDDRKKLIGTALVVWAKNQSKIVGAIGDHPQHPVSLCSSTMVVFTLTKLAFVELNRHANASDLAALPLLI